MRASASSPAELPRVALVSAQRYPHHDADTQQVMKSATALVRAGLELQLLIPPRAGRAHMPRAQRLDEIRRFYGLDRTAHIRQLPGWPAGEFQPPVKLWHGWFGALTAHREGFGLVYTREWTTVLTCLALGQPVLFETYRALGHEHPRLMAQVARLARRRAFTGLITHSRLAARSFVDRGFAPERVLVAYNGFDPRDMQPRLEQATARAALGLAADAPLVVYTGNMQPNKNLPVLVELAARVPTARFLLVGGRPEHIRSLERLAAERGVGNLDFAGQRPVSEMPRYLYSADVLIVPPTGKPLAEHGRTVLPIKTYSYLAAGRAILAPDTADLRELLIDGRNASLVEPDRPAAAAAALRALLAEPARRRTLAAGALETAAELTWDARARRILDWLGPLLQAGAGRE
jgi:glycosyltransferase involved in cell wall biosynthesis